MVKALITHGDNGAIHLKIGEHSFVIMSSGLAWLDVFGKRTSKVSCHFLFSKIISPRHIIF